MTQRKKIEDMLKTIYYKGKDGKGYSDYEISGDVAQIEDLIIEGKIRAIDSFVEAMEDDTRPQADWYREPFECVHDLVETLQASLKGKS